MIDNRKQFVTKVLLNEQHQTMSLNIWSKPPDSFGSLPNYPQFSRSPESKLSSPEF